MSLIRNRNTYIEKGVRALGRGSGVVAEALLDSEGLGEFIEVGRNLGEVVSTAKSAYGIAKSVGSAVKGGVVGVNHYLTKDLKPVGVSSSSSTMMANPSGLALQRVPISIGNEFRGQTAQMKSTKGGFRVKHRELVTSLVGSVTWTQKHFFELQPGVNTCFPWLSSIASRFQSYRSLGPVTLEFVPSVATTKDGIVYLSPSFDAEELSPLTEYEAASREGCISGSIWSPHRCVLKTKDLNGLGPRHFVRSEMVHSDIKTFDQGYVSVSFAGCANATDTVGRLFVSYDFEFYDPITDSVSSSVRDSYGLLLMSMAADLTLANATLTPITNLSLQINGIRAYLDATNQYFTLPRGRYFVEWTASFRQGTGTGLKTYECYLRKDSSCDVYINNSLATNGQNAGTYFDGVAYSTLPVTYSCMIDVQSSGQLLYFNLQATCAAAGTTIFTGLNYTSGNASPFYCRITTF